MSGRKLLDPSALGTKEYWEAAYTRELDNNHHDSSDEGVVWFDESDAEAQVIRKLNEFARTRGLLDKNQCSFLDLGTGNGHMLLALREDEGEADSDYDNDIDEEHEAVTGGQAESGRWLGEMIGVDYSPQSVVLARQLNERRLKALQSEEAPDGQMTSSYARVHFAQWDILTSAAESWLPSQPAEESRERARMQFDVVLDKGTFDAISLMPTGDDILSTESADLSPQHPCEIYREKVTAVVKSDGFLFITSCNWTKDEVIDWLIGRNGTGLQFFDEVVYPTFTFGGKSGQSVVTIVFRKLGI